MPYFRDQVVDELTSLYEFLVGMYLPADALKYPPKPGGWPNITAERFEFMEKAENVIDLMKHIPYIRQDEDDSVCDAYQVHQEAVCNDYSGDDFQRSAIKFRSVSVWQPIGDLTPSAHVLTLWRPPISDQGYTVSIDTKTGAVRRDEVIYGDRYDYADIAEFCNSIRKDFEILECVPLRPTEIALHVTEGTDEFERAVPLVQQAYLEHGWQSDNFRKEECVARVATIMEEADFSFAYPHFQDEVAQQLGSVYEMMVRMYLPADAIKFPPSEGWPHINAETVAFMGKTERVVSLMRSIPYIRQDAASHPFQMWPNLVCNDFSGNYLQDSAIRLKSSVLFEPAGEHQPLAHVLTLGRPGPLDNGYYVSIDTKDARVWLHSPELGDSRVWPDITEFCKFMRWALHDLDVVPVTPSHVERADTGDTTDRRIATIKQAYQEHGWPSSEFNKQSCEAEIEEIMKKQ